MAIQLADVSRLILRSSRLARLCRSRRRFECARLVSERSIPRTHSPDYEGDPAPPEEGRAGDSMRRFVPRPPLRPQLNAANLGSQVSGPHFLGTFRRPR
jgi:hypothetical protein